MMLIPCTAFGYSTDTEEAQPAAAPEELEGLLEVRDNDGSPTTLDAVDESEYDGFLCVMKEDTPKKDLRKMDKKIDENIEEDAGQHMEEIADGEVFAADSLQTIQEVADADNVEYIEPNYLRELTLMPSEGSVNKKNTENYRLIDVDLLWDYGITGKGVKVAVLDSGTMGLGGGRTKHQDLNYSRIIRGNTYAYRNAYATRRYSRTYGNDDHGHGTFVAGQIIAKKNNKKGITGLAPGARLISIKISNKQGLIADSDIIKGLRHAKSKGAKVVNMSLAGTNYSSSIEKECRKLANSGILIIAAAGNRGSNTYEYPASYKCVISVSAVDENGKRTGYSDYNNRIDCAAPGNYYGLGIGRSDRYRSLKGTSMAAPVVSSYAAIVKSLKPRCTVSEFRTILKKTCTDCGRKGKDPLYGYGIVNFRDMYRYLKGKTLYPKAGASVAAMMIDFKDSSRTFTGTPRTPDCGVDYLTRDRDYTVEYLDNVEVGTATVVIRGTGKYTGSVTKKFSIVPRGTSLTFLNGGKGSLNAMWKEQMEQTSGYQLRCVYLTNAGKARQTIVTVPSSRTTQKTITGLKHGKDYYVWIRTYKNVDGKKYCSPWSTTYRYAYVR